MTGVVPNEVARAAQLFQFYELLTGIMTGQPMTVRDALYLNNQLGIDFAEVVGTPAAPGAGKGRLYYKQSSGWYYRIGAAGAETALVTPPNGSVTPAMLQLTGAVAANTVLRGLSGSTMGFGQIVPGDFTPGTTTLVKVAEGVLGSPASNVDITSIPSTYRHLMLMILARGDTAAADTGARMRFNNDTAANYDAQAHEAFGNSNTYGFEFQAGTSMYLGEIPANTATANVFAGLLVHIPYYASTVAQKVAMCQVAQKFGTTSDDLMVGIAGGYWRNTAAINRITVFPSAGNFQTDTVVTLYGLPA